MITTIIPCYNAEIYLAEAIESVLAQTRATDEILVVDDCSTDSSREIASQYPVALLQTPTNSGHATARNIGINAARGEIIAWLDADDYWEPNHLETVVGLLDQFPEAGVAFSGVRFFGDRDGFWTNFPCDGEPKDVFESCARTTVVPAMSAVTRRAELLEVGGFDESVRVAPDFDLWLRMSLTSRFVSTSDITSNYRWHNAQISSRQRFKQTVSMFRSRNQVATSLRHTQNNQRAEFIENCSRESFEFLVWAAWTNNDPKALRNALSVDQFVINGTRVASKYRWRLHILERTPRVANLLLSIFHFLNKRSYSTI